MQRLAIASGLLLLGLAVLAPSACSVKTSESGGGGTCPCVIGTGITVTIACGQSTCYELNGTARGVSCDEDGQHDDPSACTSGGTSTSRGGDGGVTTNPVANPVTNPVTTPPVTTSPTSPWPSTIGCQATAARGHLTDCDGDGVPDATDDCPGVANADQADADKNGIGDACEASYANCKKLGGAVTAADFSGQDLRACDITIEPDPTNGATPANFDDADLSCSTVTFVGATGSFDGTKLSHACLNLPSDATTTFAQATLTGASFADGTVVLTGGDASGASFTQNSSVTTTGTTMTGAIFTQVEHLSVTGGSIAGATLTQDEDVSLTSCDASGADLDESTVKLKSVNVDKMTCEIGTISCASGDTGTLDPSCVTTTAPPACP